MARMTNVVVFISFRARRSSNVVFESGTGIGLIFRNRFAAHAAGRGGVNHRDRFNLDALRASAFRNPQLLKAWWACATSHHRIVRDEPVRCLGGFAPLFSLGKELTASPIPGSMEA